MDKSSDGIVQENSSLGQLIFGFHQADSGKAELLNMLIMLTLVGRYILLRIQN